MEGVSVATTGYCLPVLHTHFQQKRQLVPSSAFIREGRTKAWRRAVTQGGDCRRMGGVTGWHFLWAAVETPLRLPTSSIKYIRKEFSMWLGIVDVIILKKNQHSLKQKTSSLFLNNFLPILEELRITSFCLSPGRNSLCKSRYECIFPLLYSPSSF